MKKYSLLGSLRHRLYHIFADEKDVQQKYGHTREGEKKNRNERSREFLRKSELESRVDMS